MAKNLGSATNFGFTGTDGITITGISGLLQNLSLSTEADTEETLDGDGDLAAINSHNPRKVASFELVVKSTGISAAITATNPPAINTFLPITACASQPVMVSDLWRVTAASVTQSNTTSARMSVTVSLNPNITAAASA